MAASATMLASAILPVKAPGLSALSQFEIWRARHKRLARMTVLMRHSGRERQADRPVCANEGANGAEALCVIVARIALPPIGCNGFRAAQPETTVGDEVRAFKSTLSMRGFAMVSSPGVDRH